jgi:hypothetical protein
VAQTFRHVLRGVDAAEVEAYVGAHRRPWWRGRHFSITVRGDRIKASRPASRSYQPPVLRGTVRAGSGGAVVEGRLTRGASGCFNVLILLVGLMSAGVAWAAIADGAPLWLSIGASASTVAFVALFVALVRVGGRVQEAEANELKGELDVFFGLRARP